MAGSAYQSQLFETIQVTKQDRLTTKLAIKKILQVFFLSFFLSLSRWLVDDFETSRTLHLMWMALGKRTR